MCHWKRLIGLEKQYPYKRRVRSLRTCLAMLSAPLYHSVKQPMVLFSVRFTFAQSHRVDSRSKLLINYKYLLPNLAINVEEEEQDSQRFVIGFSKVESQGRLGEGDLLVTMRTIKHGEKRKKEKEKKSSHSRACSHKL